MCHYYHYHAYIVLTLGQLQQLPVELEKERD
jgi:hypothetical protein